MFSVKTPYNICRSTKVVNSGSSPSFYTRDNQSMTQTLFYENNTHINNSPHSLPCLVNSTKKSLISQRYDPTRNPVIV
jgi:hypothetical protein